MKLNLTDYAVDDMDIDEQRKFNHLHCPAGTDTKQRLYIKRVAHGYVYYCHHCSKSGFIRKARLHSTSPKSPIVAAPSGAKFYSGHSKTSRFHLPKDCESTIGLWPIEARRWIKRYGISDREIKLNGICYSEYYRRLVLPVKTKAGTGIYYQMRRLYDDDERPQKYLNRSDKDVVVCRYLRHRHTDTICLVEDLLSAIKVSRHCDAYPLLSSDLSTVGLSEILKGEYKNCYIWMDDDNRQIKRQQLVLYNMLQMFIPNVVLLHTKGKDPKEHTDEEIKLELSK